MTGHLLAQHLTRGLHLIGIAVLVGALAYRYWVDSDNLSADKRRALAFLVHSCVGVILLTGLVNTVFAMKAHKGQGLYHALYGAKFLAGLAVLALVSILVGKRSAAQKMRRRERFWVGAILSICLIAILLALVLRAIPLAKA